MNHSERIHHFLFDEVDFPLESSILLIGGLALVTTGGLLLPVAAGKLPYYEEGFWGLLLIVFALQMITLGKTPFGDVTRPGLLVAGGITIAAIGIVTCCIPGFLGILPKFLLFVCLGLGGAVQFLQVCLDKHKAQTWLRLGGVLKDLTRACLCVFGLSMTVGFLLWFSDTISSPITALILIAFGSSVLYLAGILRTVYRMYPEADTSHAARAGYSFEHSILLLNGILLLLLGPFLIPVNLGMLNFSANGQLGLLMVILAIQMLAVGNTPIGPFPRRSWLMVGLGLVFALPGMVSCVIPGLLVVPLTILIGMLNLLGGLIPLLRRFIGFKSSAPEGTVHPLLRKLASTQLTLNLLSVLFGSSMLAPGLIPGLLSGAILTVNGGVLLFLLHLLRSISALASQDPKC